MVKIFNENRKNISKNRLRFVFYEITIIYLIIFGLLIVQWILLPIFIPRSSDVFSLLFYLTRSIIVFSGIILVLYLSPKVFKSTPKLKEFSIHKGQMKMYVVSKENFKYQLLYGILFLFLIFIPLQFLNFIPFTIENQAVSSLNAQQSYLHLDNFLLFITLSIIIQAIIAFTDVSIYFGLITKRGSEYYNKISAAFISTLYFVLSNFLLNPYAVQNPYNFGIIVFLKSFLIGLAFSFTLIRKKWLFPLIFAFSIDNVLSNIIIWFFLNGANYYLIMILFYFPLITIAIVLLVLQKSRILDSLLIGSNLIKSYFREEEKKSGTIGDKIFQVLCDLLVAILLFLIGIIISV